MTNITIIGAGNMGQAISGLVTRGGNSVQLLTRNDKDTAVAGDIVVLALPYGSLEEVVAERSDQLAGKVVVDISNPLDFATFDSLVVPSDSSATAELAGRLPQSKVLKAFNTNFAATLNSGKVGDDTVTVLIAGDDKEAKDSLAAVIEAAGLVALDLGGLKRARELEAVGFAQLVLAATEQVGWTAGLAIVR